MSEKKASIHGLSVVDATTNDTPSKEEDDITVKDEVLKIEDEVDATVHFDNGCEVIIAEDSFLEEAEEKINLFDVLDQSDEPEKKNKISVRNSTLIITTEEHLDTTTCEDTLNISTETVKNLKKESVNVESNLEESKKSPNKSRLKSEDQGYLWVSNISRHVKATNLKKFFSQIGKVLTAKVLTNGRNYFGYVSVDTAETAAKCIRQLNNSLFEGKKVVVSKERPDLREVRSSVKVESRKRKCEKFELENKKSMESKEEKSKMSKPTEEKDSKTNDIVSELNKKLEKYKAEANRYKYKLTEYQHRQEEMRKKCVSLEKELKEIQYQMRSERRRLNQDKEQFEKNKKLELARLESDRTFLNKELENVKKLREHLKAKIDDINAQSKKGVKRRDIRSPLPMEPSRSPRGRSPVMRIGSRVTFRSDNRMDKKKKRDEPPRGRTPPPPPKLSNGMGKKRSENLPHRQYFTDFEKRTSTLERAHELDYRHKPTFPPPQELPRTPWPASYPKDPRRLNATPSNAQSYPSDPRYSGSYQFPPSSITIPPRSYYPEFGKSYGHY